MKAYRVGLTGGLASGKSTIAGWLRDAGCVVIDADRLVADLYRPGAPGAAAVRDLFGPAALTPEGAVDHAAVAARVFADDGARRRLEAAIHPLVRRRFEDLAAAAEAEPQAATSAQSTSANAAQPQTATAAQPESATAAQPESANAARPQSANAAQPEAAEATGPQSAAVRSTRLPPIVVLEATLLVEAGYGPGFDVIVTVEADPSIRLRRAVARGLAEPAARARLAAQGDGAARRQGAQRVIDNSGDLAELRRRFDPLLADLRRDAVEASAAPAAAAADKREFAGDELHAARGGWRDRQQGAADEPAESVGRQASATPATPAPAPGAPDEADPAGGGSQAVGDGAQDRTRRARNEPAGNGSR